MLSLSLNTSLGREVEHENSIRLWWICVVERRARSGLVGVGFEHENSIRLWWICVVGRQARNRLVLSLSTRKSGCGGFAWWGGKRGVR